MNDVKYEYKRSNLKSGGKKLSVPVERKLRRPKQNSKLNHEIKNKTATKRLKRTVLPRPDTEAALKLSKVVEPTESVSDAAEQPSKESECLSENQPSPTREDFPIHNSCSSGMSVEESDARSCVEEIEHVENSEQERPSMKRTEKFKYCVIQFLELPYQDIDEYVCVPWSWIVLRRKMDKKVIVTYPVENPSETAKRVKRRQKPSDDWKFYMSVEKYGTDLYEDAKIFINGKMNDVKYEYKRSNLKNGGKKLPVPVERKISRPKKNVKSNHEIDKPLDFVVTSKKDDKSATKRLKRTALPKPDTEAALKLSKVVEPTESVSDAAEQPSKASECLSENQPSPTREDFPIHNSCSSGMSVEESDARSCVEEIEYVENSEQERPSVFQNSSNLMNSLSNRNPMLDPTFSTELFTVLRNLHTVSANSYTLVDSLRRVIIDNTEAMKDVKQLIVDSRSLNSNIATTCPSTNTTAEVEKISEINKSKQKQRDEEYDDHGDDDTDEVSKKKRFQKRKFVLPPEYDENDSRWTLKHREMAPGLVELMPHTNVYINAVKLSNCKRLSKDCKSLARMLLVEIFTKGALTVCSLTGSRAKAYDVEGATIRPGLDENARTVLLTYVEEYCREKGWTTLDTQSIQNSIRNKIQEFRVKYG